MLQRTASILGDFHNLVGQGAIWSDLDISAVMSSRLEYGPPEISSESSFSMIVCIFWDILILIIILKTTVQKIASDSRPSAGHFQPYLGKVRLGL